MRYSLRETDSNTPYSDMPFIARMSRGGIPEKAEANIARVRRCLWEVLAALPSVLATVHES